MISRRVVVRGLVQGVGFRYALVEAATSFGAKGWVRNRRDGTVEAVIEGDPDVVQRVIAWCRHGPRGARVAAVDVAEEAANAGYATFEQRPTA